MNLENKIFELAYNKKIFVAYSGGLDSHVLLHLLVGAQKKWSKTKLIAIHVNHNLSPNAKKWATHCKKICKDLSVNCVVKSVNAKIKIKDHSPEEVARKLRYEVFSNSLPKDAFLVTAHQANDQAETLLLQLFRGAGPKGLSSMPVKIEFASGWLVRPLLDFSREELLQYAKKYKLNWIEDESNNNTKFDRNFIRYQLIPQIQARWPGIITTLNRAAKHCANANLLLENLASNDLAKIISDNKSININELKKNSIERQYNVLRFWLYTLKLPTLSEVVLKEVIRTAINSRCDTKPLIKLPDIEIRRFKNFLYAISPLVPHDNKIVLRLCLNKTLKLPSGLGLLRIKINKKFKVANKSKIFTVRFRCGGERLKLSKRQGTHKLKKLMQEWQIPLWLRDRIPLVYCDQEIIAVAGYYCINNIKLFIEE